MDIGLSSSDLAELFRKLMSTVGEVVTLNLKNGDCIQGRIKFVSKDTHEVRLERPFMNGRPMRDCEQSFPINTIASFKFLCVPSPCREEEISCDAPKDKKVSSNIATGKQNEKETTTKTPTNAEKTPRTKQSSAAAAAAGDGFLKTPKRASGYQGKAKSGSTNATATTTTGVQIGATGRGAAGFPSSGKIGYNSKYHRRQSPSSSPPRSTSSSPIQAKAKLGHRRETENRAPSNRRFHGYDSEPRSPWVTGSGGRRRRTFGHYGQCGIPQLDFVDPNVRIHKSNEDLSKPIDFDLDEDFDFEKNLEIFRNFEKEDDNQTERKKTASSGAPFARTNYEHFENVVSDPTRVTSWTTKGENNDLFVAKRTETTKDGQRIPFMKFREKEKLLQKAEPYVGSDIFHVLIADRLMMFLWSVIDRFAIMVSQVVVLDSAAVNTYLTTMFLRHISNRACNTIVYSCLLGQYNLPRVRQVHEVRELPKTNVEVVVVLGPIHLTAVKEWIKTVSPPAHLICIEKPLGLSKNEHILMICVGTDLEDSHKGKTDSECLRGVVDIGIPFNWMDPESAACLSETFATQTIVLC